MQVKNARTSSTIDDDEVVGQILFVDWLPLRKKYDKLSILDKNKITRRKYLKKAIYYFGVELIILISKGYAIKGIFQRLIKEQMIPRTTVWYDFELCLDEYKESLKII